MADHMFSAPLVSTDLSAPDISPPALGSPACQLPGGGAALGLVGFVPANISAESRQWANTAHIKGG